MLIWLYYAISCVRAQTPSHILDSRVILAMERSVNAGSCRYQGDNERFTGHLQRSRPLRVPSTIPPHLRRIRVLDTNHLRKNKGNAVPYFVQGLKTWWLVVASRPCSKEYTTEYIVTLNEKNNLLPATTTRPKPAWKGLERSKKQRNGILYDDQHARFSFAQPAIHLLELYTTILQPRYGMFSELANVGRTGWAETPPLVDDGP